MLRDALADFLRADPERYARVFLDGKPIRASRGELARFQIFESAGLAAPVLAGSWMPRVRVMPFEGRFVAADLATHRDADQVFSPMFEQVYVARTLPLEATDTVLEIGVGSGVLSIMAAGTARRVTAVDLHARALAFAAFNRDLNGLTDRIDLRQGSLFDPLDAGAQFDVVLTNPPFEPVPPGATYFHHSAGGADGLEVVRAILANVDGHLLAGGRFAIVTWSPGTTERSLLEAMLQAAFPAHHIRVDVLEISPLEPMLRRFARAKGYAAWHPSFAARGLTHLHFVFAHVEPASTPSLERREPTDAVAACHAVSDAWI